MSDELMPLCEGSGAGASWLLSMTDLVSLLAAAFIMLFSMSSVETAKWRQFARFQTAKMPAVADRSAAVEPSVPAALPRARHGDAADLGYLGAVLAQKFAADPVLKEALLARREDGLAIALPGDLLFAPGSANPSREAQAALRRLGEALRPLANAVEVRGHSDPRPIETAEFASNWELSIARARAVARGLADAGYDRGIVALGDADSRYGDLDPAIPEAERMRLARRVDVILRPRAAGGEPR
jgi:chemotaxis protein MotB